MVAENVMMLFVVFAMVVITFYLGCEERSNYEKIKEKYQGDVSYNVKRSLKHMQKIYRFYFIASFVFLILLILSIVALVIW